MQDGTDFDVLAMGTENGAFSKKVKVWASASVLAMCPLLAQPAVAQEAEETTEAEAGGDEIVVTGIRANIKSAQNIKRNADTFVDSISAEDIGSLPDRSVNETLQRIPGISISRFAAADDPDHFSVEGSGVVIRGLTFVRSELNGRDVFSANNGRALGFNDVSPELLGGVDVFKQQTADMIEGGLAGVVNLRTRKPLDEKDLVIAASIEANYGDARKDWTPTYSGLISNVFPSEIGDFGVLLSYSRSELNSRAFGTQLTDYNFRTDIEPGETFLVPRGAGARIQDFDRERESIGGALQWEANDGSAKATLEFLRVEATSAWTERSFESTADQGYQSRPVPGTSFEFDEDGLFTSGFLTDSSGWRSGVNCPVGVYAECVPLNGFQHTQVARAVDQDTMTQDISFNVELRPTDQLKLSFDAQYIEATTENLDFTIYGSTFANVFIDTGAGDIPDVRFSAPTPDGSEIENYFVDPRHSFYRAAMAHIEDSEGDEFAFRGDLEYEFDGDSFLRKIRAGGRFSSREQKTRWSEYGSNWGVLSEIWTGAGPVFLSQAATGDTENFDFPNFQRGSVSTPVVSPFYAGDILAGYRDGTVIDDLIAINNQWVIPGWRPVEDRPGAIEGGYLPGEINDTREETLAAYLRLDFGSDDIFGGMRLNGNIGLRYVKTLFNTKGSVQAPIQGGTLNPNADCTTPSPNPPDICELSPERRAEALAFASGTSSFSQASSSFSNWLPSLNLKLGVTDDVILRFGISRGLSRPDLGLTRNFLVPTQNITNVLNAGGDLATAPLFIANAGNPNLRPVTATNIDLSAEWYFAPTGAITLSGFYKDIKDIITSGSEIREITNGEGVTTDVVVAGSRNSGSGSVKGFELSYNQFYDFLPGPLSGLGFQGNYSYIKPSSLPNTNLNPTSVNGTQPEPTINNLPLQGLSRHNFNAALLYEKYGISARAAYSWRSRYLLTTRDVIFPHSPIWHDATGQLDASIFYTINDNIKVGVQGVNLLNEVTVTRSQVDAPDGSGFGDRVLAPRSYFTNDRRFTFIARFTF